LWLVADTERVTVTPQLKAIVLAGGLAALALVLGFFTLSMNQPSSTAATPKPILSLKARRHLAAAKPKSKSKPVVKPKVKAKPKPKPNANVMAALEAGLPHTVAAQFATHRVVVVELYSPDDSVDGLARGEAESGAALAGAGFVAVDVAKDGDSATLTKLLGTLPPAPAALVYARPAALFVTLPGFNDHTTIQQAALNADPDPAAEKTAANDWADEAGALCKATVAKANALGGPTADAQLLKAKPKFDAIMTSFLAQMKALKPTPGTEAQVTQLNALFTQNIGLVDDMLVALAKKDLVALGQATQKQSAVATKLNELERQLGATGCAELS
jgi:hypothetical protein